MTTDTSTNAGEETLWASAYGDLKSIARSRIRDARSPRLIDTTALVHESWVKLAAVKHFNSGNRRQFFVYASKVMRSIIVDMAKSRGRAKRGGGAMDVTFDPTCDEPGYAAAEPVQLDNALRELERSVPRLSQVVEMRYFGGLTEADIADVLGVTERTVRREWQKARLMLREMLAD